MDAQVFSSHPQQPVRLRASGAVAAPDLTPDAGVAWHYGDPFGEQRAASHSAVLIDRSHRGVIGVSGDERLSWLHTISSQYVNDLADRRSAENLNLDGNGRVEDHFVMTDLNGVTWIDTEGSRTGELTTFLQRMIFWAKVEVNAHPDMTVMSLLGPNIRGAAISGILGIPEDATVYDAGELPDVGWWRIMPPLGEQHNIPTVDLVVPERLADSLWSTLTAAGARAAGIWAYEALRVAATRPRLGVDTDERTIPHEVGWIGSPADFGAVHLDKGCYRGQETIARVHNLGKPPRRLVLLHLDGSADVRPLPGSPVTAGGRTVGRVGTVVEHFEFGPIALALVKRSVQVQAELAADGVAASIDPESYRDDDGPQAGRDAIERLRRNAPGPRGQA